MLLINATNVDYMERCTRVKQISSAWPEWHSVFAKTAMTNRLKLCRLFLSS